MGLTSLDPFDERLFHLLLFFVDYNVYVFVDMVMDAEPESVTASAEHQREEELQVYYISSIKIS